jgi:hypothetical protein
MPMNPKPSALAALILSIAAAAGAACGSDDDGGSVDGDPQSLAAGPAEATETSQAALSWGSFPAPGPTTKDTPVGLAFEIAEGAGVPLQVRKNQRFYINQIDMRASLTTTVDEGVTGLDRTGDFASLDWKKTSLADQTILAEPNADGTYTRQRFYRNSRWMDLPSAFVIEQVDAQGRVVALPLIIDTGLEQLRTPIDSFFVRRMRAIQWTYDCASPTDCSNAHSFSEEALIELRYANGPNPSFQFRPETTALRVTWSHKPSSPYTIPVQQVAAPEWDYGFGIQVTPETPPAANGTYAAGQDVSFAFTLTDGAGKSLHPGGPLPSFLDYLGGNTPSGVQYWKLDEPYATYYRRKHRERQMFASISGPAQDIQPIRTVTNLVEVIDPATESIIVGTQARDGVYGAAASVPGIFVLFDASRWADPVDNHFRFHIPDDAKPGTYLVTLKARRKYLGEDIPKATTIKIQVGSPTPTTATLHTGKCDSCHQDGSSFSRISHGLTDRSTCAPCHTPLTNELEGPAYVRTHFIHSRSNRVDVSMKKCETCHLDKQSTQRVSKSACLSCHTSYPASHVAQFGPIKNMYVGGGQESFTQCTTACHTTHPGSHL